MDLLQLAFFAMIEAFALPLLSAAKSCFSRTSSAFGTLRNEALFLAYH
jgi:hypothetical protein